MTGGKVALLVVLYSINVFFTFSLSLLGLASTGGSAEQGPALAPSACPLAWRPVVTGGILLVTLVEKFTEGGWMTVLITGTRHRLLLLNHAHYAGIKREDPHRRCGIELDRTIPPIEDPLQARSAGTHGRLRRRLEPQWRDLRAAMGAARVSRAFQELHLHECPYGGCAKLRRRREHGRGCAAQANQALEFFVNYCHQLRTCRRNRSSPSALTRLRNSPSSLTNTPGVSRQHLLHQQADFKHDNWYIRQLHSEAALTMLRQLHLRDMPMVVLPMRL